MKSLETTQSCPLCGGLQTEPFHQDRRRDYYRCSICHLVFVPPAYHLSREAEKTEYDRHQNRPDDPAYRRFLNRLFKPLQLRLVSGSRGLDFGSGPGPTLAPMLTEIGHDVALYDPFYAPRPAVLSGRYDFITATEVVEHLHRPGPELDRLYRHLNPGGLLGIMTKRVIDRERFARWHYINDPTHVCFFSRATFVWLAARWGARLDFVDRDVIMITKPQENSTPTGMPLPLNAATFACALGVLVSRDADLAQVVARFGPPPFWRRKPCFATLVRIILEQQVSLASAQAVFRRLATMVVPFSATRFRQLGDDRLAAAGLTRQKRACCRALAEAIATRHLRLNALAGMPDADTRRALMGIKGIGPWTADIYLLMALKRPDIWPCGDLALNKALMAIKNLSGRIPETDLAAIAAAWHPWRAVAARILWHYYLSIRDQGAPSNF